jgi:phenylacetate-coenzyme A ligase PaaK-like adenylate-forming protein
MQLLTEVSSFPGRNLKLQSRVRTRRENSYQKVVKQKMSVEGRSEDLIVLKSGRVFTPRMIIDSIANIPEIYKFRVSYLGKNRFRVDLVSFNNQKKVIEIMGRKLQNLFKENVILKFNITDDITKSKRGKRKITYFTPED